MKSHQQTDDDQDAEESELLAHLREHEVAVEVRHAEPPVHALAQADAEEVAAIQGQSSLWVTCKLVL